VVVHISRIDIVGIWVMTPCSLVDDNRRYGTIFLLSSSMKRAVVL